MDTQLPSFNQTNLSIKPLQTPPFRFAGVHNFNYPRSLSFAKGLSFNRIRCAMKSYKLSELSRAEVESLKARPRIDFSSTFGMVNPKLMLFVEEAMLQSKSRCYFHSLAHLFHMVLFG
ncbi:hypothetical protein SLE2022_172600 [Rubroshorea leprosula]